ncbi:hypothetical protein EC2756500_0960 [Escherichia coli 2756500]|nr:hypothetical protein EC2756500_0960 [Escherichia coli 2756500]
MLKVTKSQIQTLFPDFKIEINKINELHFALKKGSIWYFFISYFLHSF